MPVPSVGSEYIKIHVLYTGLVNGLFQEFEAGFETVGRVVQVGEDVYKVSCGDVVGLGPIESISNGVPKVKRGEAEHYFQNLKFFG